MIRQGMKASSIIAAAVCGAMLVLMGQAGPAAIGRATTGPATRSAPTTTPATAPAPAAKTAWGIEVDSAFSTDQLAMAATRPAILAADPNRIKPNLKQSGAFPSNRDFIGSNRPSRFLLTIAPSGGDGWELFDLKAPSRIGGTAKLDLADPALAPGGVFVAGYKHGADDIDSIELWSFRTGQRIARFPFEKEDDPADGGLAHALGFDKADHPIIFFPKDHAIRVMDPASGMAVAEIKTTARGLSQENVALSSSGKYLALAFDGTVTLYDTATGAAVATASYAAADPTWRGTTDATAFSPAGLDLAVAQRGPDVLKITLISCANGHVQAQRVIPWKEPGTRIPHLQWNLDGRGLLLGQSTLLDRNTLLPAMEIPPDATAKVTRWGDINTLLRVAHDGSNLTFATMEVPASALAKASGRDLPLPVELARAEPAAWDVKSAPEVPLERAGAQKWTTKAADVPAATLAPRFTTSEPSTPPRMGLPGSGGAWTSTGDVKFERAVFTSREANIVYLDRALRSTDGKTRITGWVDQVNASDGKALSTMQLPAGMELLDASPSGKRVLCRSESHPGIADRLDVYTVDAGEWRPVAAGMPFAGAEADDTATEPPSAIRWATLIDDTHLLALSHGRMIACIDLAANKVTWRYRFAPGVAGRPVPVPVIMPSRRLAAMPMPKGICVFDTRTGGAVNVLPVQDAAIAPAPIAFTQDGGKLAVQVNTTGVLSAVSSTALRIIDLTTGVAGEPMFLQGVGSGTQLPGFVSPDYVMLSDGSLVDVAHGCVIWHYRFGENPPAIGSARPYAEALSLAQAQAGSLPRVLTMALPHQEVLDLPAKNRVSGMDFGPGMKVKLKVAVVGDDNYRDLQVAEWTKRLKEMGITVADDAPLTLDARTFVLRGDTVWYNVSQFGPNVGSKVVYTPVGVGYRIQLLKGDKELWKSEETTKPVGSVPDNIELQIRDRESAQQAFDRRYANVEPRTASHIETPPAMIMGQARVAESTVNMGKITTAKTP